MNTKSNFHIGDHVRIFKSKKLFAKGGNKLWKSIYEITGTKDNQYILKNISSGKIKYSLPVYMTKIDVKELITIKETRARNPEKQKSEIAQYKTEQKQKRFMNKKGLN